MRQVQLQQSFSKAESSFIYLIIHLLLPMYFIACLLCVCASKWMCCVCVGVFSYGFGYRRRRFPGLRSERPVVLIVFIYFSFIWQDRLSWCLHFCLSRRTVPCLKPRTKSSTWWVQLLPGVCNVFKSNVSCNESDHRSAPKLLQRHLLRLFD